MKRLAAGDVMFKRVLILGVVLIGFAAAPGLCVASPDTIEVKIEHFAYVPEIVKVAPGDTIVFVNEDIVPHTATAADQSWTTGEIAHGESARVIIPENAGADYFCAFHPMMTGRLMIAPAEAH